MHRFLVPALCLVALTAEAQGFSAIKAPYTSIVPSPAPGGTSLEYCPGTDSGAPIPLEWDILIDNPASSALTLGYDDVVTDGYNGDRLTLVCPPTYLPPGVDPVADVQCDPVTGRIQVQNIGLPGCSDVRIRFETVVDAPNPIDICTGGELSDGVVAMATESPLVDQVPAPLPPSPPSDTCIRVNPLCNLNDNKGVRLVHTLEDANGPPLLPGDIVRKRTEYDLRFVDLFPTLVMNLMYENSDALTLAPLPAELEFINFVSIPLAPDADYIYDAPTRELSIVDLTPGAPPDPEIPARGIREIVSWDGQVSCDAPVGVPICLDGYFQGPLVSARADDPSTYDELGDPACVTPILPDFAGSEKTVTDATGDGLAEPGEVLTFRIEARNDGPCPDRALDCECEATNVTIIDTVDLGRLENLVPLDGGVLIAADSIRWIVPSVAAEGGTAPAVRFEATVRADVTDGDQICNIASVTSDELVSVLDGGKLNCPSVPPTVVVLNPCIEIGTSLPPIKELWVAGNPPDVQLSWLAPPIPVDGYNVCYFTGKLGLLDGGCGTGEPVPGCSPTTASSCTHTAANPPGLFIYQVKGIFDGEEGP